VTRELAVQKNVANIYDLIINDFYPMKFKINVF